MKTVTIIGFGRFGQTLYRLIKDDFIVTVYTRKPVANTIKSDSNLFFTNSLAKAYESDVIFFAVPVENFKQVVHTHKKYFTDLHLLIDLLSVKMHADEVFTQELHGTKTRAILTHPMFGPDSRSLGFAGLPLIICNHSATYLEYSFWVSYFKKKQITVIEISAKEHDKLAADSQGLTHFIGRMLEQYPLLPTAIDSLGTKKLLEVKEQTCNDTWQLFTGLQHFNPYTKRMRLRLGETYTRLHGALLPKRLDPAHITIGIQGGLGSFNEEAVSEYVKIAHIKKYKIVYLNTSKNVLRALHLGDIDLGQFAIHNSVGGVVDESIQAMAAYTFKIVKEFAIKISHTLMIRSDVSMKDITTIMTHPQVLAQCKGTLNKRYPLLKQTSGSGNLIDHAVVAKQLVAGILPPYIATMGSSVLADIYGLQVVEHNLQDAKENFTSFLVVSR